MAGPKDIEVDFTSASDYEDIPRIRDAELRLDCFRVISQASSERLTLNETFEAAKRLYDWAMELTDDEESDTEEVIATSEEGSKCDVKH